MAKLGELTTGVFIRGTAGDAITTVVNENWYGSNRADLVYPFTLRRLRSHGSEIEEQIRGNEAA
jgi:hypothetical protein